MPSSFSTYKQNWKTKEKKSFLYNIHNYPMWPFTKHQKLIRVMKPTTEHIYNLITRSTVFVETNKNKWIHEKKEIEKNVTKIIMLMLLVVHKERNLLLFEPEHTEFYQLNSLSHIDLLYRISNNYNIFVIQIVICWCFLSSLYVQNSYAKVNRDFEVVRLEQ